MTFRQILAASLVTILASAGCDSTNPASPSGSLAGVWSGTIVDAGSGGGTLRFELVDQQGGGLTGTWVTTFADSTNNSYGELSVTPPLGSPLQFGLDCARMGAALFTMTVTGSRMEGTYSGVMCPGLTSGTARLGKR